MNIRILKKFLELESAGGIILFFMAIVAMVWANSSFAYLHQQFVAVSLFGINEGLMAIFFLIVGMELKREFCDGHLSQPSMIVLPAVGALGGMILPALIYALINHGHPTLRGWATPVATDIAFALGVLSLFNKRIPIQLKLFLLALAIYDDLGAIVIIALFYSHGLSYLSLFQSVVFVIILYIFNRLNVRSVLPYLLIGAWLWWAMLHSGIHPTIAGVIVALFIPDGESYSPLRYLEDRLHPWVAYLILPLFALANAGVPLTGLTWQSLLDPVVLGIVLGLFVGKQIGVFGFSWIMIKLKWAKLPENATWWMLYGVSLLCGIGFTMSLFLGTLSFQNQDTYLAEVRLGVMIGSVLSALAGAFVLFWALKFNHRRRIVEQ